MRSLRTLLLVEMFEPVAIGERIKQARIEAGLIQEELGDLIGMSTRTVQSYEAGTSSPYRKIREISAVTSRSVEWLLHGDPDGEPAPDLSGQAVALVLDRLESLEVKLEEQARQTVRALQGLEAGIARLENRRDDEGRRERTP